MNKNIIITGVAGLIGSRFADWVLQNKPEYNVIGIDDLSGGYLENVNPRVKFYNRQIGVTSTEDLFKKYQPEYVFHYAAYAAECLSPFIRKYNYQNNLVASADIINNSIKYSVKRLVFTSTLAVYGNSIPPFDETLTPNPIDPYGVSKYACEMDIRIAGEQHGLDWCIIRPHNVYGVKQNIWDKYRNVLGIWMYQYMNNEPMTIFGDGLQTRAFSFIDDSLPCMWKAAELPTASKQIINIGGKTHTHIKDACQILQKVIGGGDIVFKEARHEVKNAYVTWQKSVDVLGYEEKYSLEQGITEMWNWAKSQPKRERFIWVEYELDKGIYSYWK
jgi:UDP-glucose 4-epimerase